MRKNLSKKTLSAFLAIVMTLATMAGMFTFSAGAAQTEDSSAKLTADTSWHTADTAGLEFTLTEPNDFLGFISLIRSGKTFEGQTVKLGNDIDLNQGWNADSYVDGTGVTWSTSGSSANKPINIINYNNKFFAGTFDGQGYAISGIYYKTANTSGLFGQINTGAIAEIKNLTIENSFFGDVNKNNHCALIGGMSGTAVFSNIHIKENVYMATNMGNGAFFVGLNKGTVTISNSIVEGTIITYDHTTARDSLTFGGFLAVNCCPPGRPVCRRRHMRRPFPVPRSGTPPGCNCPFPPERVKGCPCRTDAAPESFRSASADTATPPG